MTARGEKTVTTNPTVPNLLVGTAIAAVTGIAMFVINGGDGDMWWAYPLIGAILALALWGMLLAGSYGHKERRGIVEPRSYAIAGLLGVVAGSIVGTLTGENSFWAVGFIIAGVLLPAASASTGKDRS
ncbi:hypothetical protein FB459_0408 [Yimella lutea]|uniref:Uncharacterized protein n=1 Tax=Yimella lutea TaxID=587872 RepID=A0A542ECG0_9MICO|nr:hypothetical protein [Yimella lutea]TQJ13023.1 hypothetical protein FB459_0408 [Yimella lutea]